VLLVVRVDTLVMADMIVQMVVNRHLAQEPQNTLGATAVVAAMVAAAVAALLVLMGQETTGLIPIRERAAQVDLVMLVPVAQVAQVAVTEIAVLPVVLAPNLVAVTVAAVAAVAAVATIKDREHLAAYMVLVAGLVVNLLVGLQTVPPVVKV
jgi:hypothetical protein